MGFNSEMHCGNFSSSDIFKLLGSKKVRETYIHEKSIERKLGRVLKSDFSSRAVSWGHLMEYETFHKQLGTEYSLISTVTVAHPTVDGWVGSPDCHKYFEATKGVCDIKGLQLKSFCDIVDAWERGKIQEVRNQAEDGEKFYQQIVSNACITGCQIGELILRCPYKSELDAIRNLVNNGYDGPDPGRFKWIGFAEDDELAYLPDNGYYKNLYRFAFPIPSEDKIKLHNAVAAAVKELPQFTNLQLA